MSLHATVTACDVVQNKDAGGMSLPPPPCVHVPSSILIPF